MSLFPVCPGTDTIIRTDEIIRHKYRIVTICNTSYHLTVIVGSPISTSVVCAEGIGEAAARMRKKGRWEGTRRAFCEERIASFKVEGSFGFEGRLRRDRSCGTPGRLTVLGFVVLRAGVPCKRVLF